MPDLDRCRERAEDCRRKAELASGPGDRAQWLKLAEDWIAFSRIPFQSELAADTTPAPQPGLWRGEFLGRRTG